MSEILGSENNWVESFNDKGLLICWCATMKGAPLLLMPVLTQAGTTVLSYHFLANPLSKAIVFHVWRLMKITVSNKIFHLYAVKLLHNNPSLTYSLLYTFRQQQ